MLNVSPHRFEPAGRFTLRRRKCRHCYCPPADHPLEVATQARPYAPRWWWH